MPSIRKSRIPSGAGLLAALLFLTASGSCLAQAAETGAAIAPKFLVDVTSPDAIKQIRPNYGDPVYTVDKTGIAVSLPAARANFPGIQIIPATGDAWDLTPFGHIEAKIVNTGSTIFRITMRVDSPVANGVVSNTEVIGVKPGESKILKVIFGYNFGFHPGNQAVNSSKITQIILFLAKSDQVQSFRVEDLQGAGPAGEKPPFNPDYVVTKPERGIILGKGMAFDPAKQVVATGAKVAAAADGALAVTLAGGKEESLRFKPAMGAWNLNDANQIRVTFKNTGAAPVTPTVVVGPNKVSAPAPVAPGAETEVTVSFIPDVVPRFSSEPVLVNGAPALPGTGTKFESNKAKEFNVLFDSTPGAKGLLITSIIADAAIADIPDWLGKRPPVEGDWVQTFTEEFDGPTLDYNKWNIYGNNFWDKRTHFSKDNAILKDGKMIFRYEKKTGFHNDDPNDFQADHRQTDYVCGFLNTYGKFTQRYGYFEARMKLPTAPGLWPALWLMPDRGRNSRSRHRPAGGGRHRRRRHGIRHHGIPLRLGALSVQYRLPLGWLWQGTQGRRFAEHLCPHGQGGVHHHRPAVDAGPGGDLQQRQGGLALGKPAGQRPAGIHHVRHGFRRLGQPASGRCQVAG